MMFSGYILTPADRNTERYIIENRSNGIYLPFVSESKEGLKKDLNV
jgi:hypothetical protein